MPHITKAEQKEQDRQEAIARLRALAPAKSTIYVVVKHVSRSGMQRHIAAFIQTPTGLRNISGDVAEIVGWKWLDDDSVAVSGCGMDMGFHLVYTLASYVWRNTPEAAAYADEMKDSKWRSGDASYLYSHRWL